MKKNILTILFVISAKLLLGQTLPPEYDNLIIKAEGLYRTSDYKKSALAYSGAFKTLAWRVIPTGRYTDDCYNAARSWSMANNLDSAFFYLERIVKKLSFADSARISKEEAFNPMHNDQRWQSLMNNIRQNKPIETPSMFLNRPSLPSGWYPAGSKPGNYIMGIDKGTGQDGKNTATIQSIGKVTNGFGTLMQDFLPDKYRGKRIRMTGFMKSKDVIGWAGFWLRMDQPGSQQSASYFDNMHDRSIRGNTDWKKYEIVLDVPADAINIAFGALLNEAGQIWFDNIKFEVVDNSVPTTGSKNSGNKNVEPVNLDFEK